MHDSTLRKISLDISTCFLFFSPFTHYCYNRKKQRKCSGNYNGLKGEQRKIRSKISQFATWVLRRFLSTKKNHRQAKYPPPRTGAASLLVGYHVARSLGIKCLGLGTLEQYSPPSSLTETEVGKFFQLLKSALKSGLVCVRQDCSQQHTTRNTAKRVATQP